MIKIGLDKKDLDKGVKETKSSFKDMGKQLLVTTAAITGAGVAIYAAGKQIYEVGKRGAMVTQTADSFEYLSEKLALPTDLLQQLRKESKGTITDFKLMSSTATLLAGTSDELGKALGTATPELMRIAKAANKLNPSLGTTSHMYESIALGIKRASPMILDNLGLTIKIGDANEKMAKSLGKSVDQLTAEEKQMALLNATLEAGDNLIQQVGGNTDSATDAFARLETEIGNLKDSVAEGLAPAIADILEKFNNYTTAANTLADTVYLLQEAEEAGIISSEKLVEMVDQLATGALTAEDALFLLEQATIRNDLATGNLGKQVELTDYHVGLYSAGLGEAEGATDGLTEASEEATQATSAQKDAADLLTTAMKGYTESLLFNIIAADMDKEAAYELAVQFGLVDERSVGAYKAVNYLTEKYDLNKDGVISLTEMTDEYIAAVLALKGALDSIPGTQTKGLHFKITYGGGAVGGGGGRPAGGGGTIPKPIVDPSIYDSPDFGGQHGLDMVVPPGFPGDKFPVFASSGERVIIQRKDQQRSGSIGSNMMAGVSGGIGAGYKDTARDTMSAMGGLVKSAEKALGIASPSAMFYDIGIEMMRGLELGIRQGEIHVNDALADISKWIDVWGDDIGIEIDHDSQKWIDIQAAAIHMLKQITSTELYNIEELWGDLWEVLKDDAEEGFVGVIGEVDRGWRDINDINEQAMDDFEDIIRIGWTDVMYITDEFSKGYIDVWDKTAEGTRDAALKILGYLDDVQGFVPSDDYWDKWRVPDEPLVPDPKGSGGWASGWYDYDGNYHEGSPPSGWYSKTKRGDDKVYWYPPDYQWPAMQHGGSFVVPPGYPNDSFPMAVSSGERVTVQRKDQQRGGSRSQNILNIYTNAPVESDVPDLLLLRAWSNG